MGNWAELHQDLLLLIVKQIDILEDFVAFSRVCKSWRLIADTENFNGYQQIPWLMLAEEWNGSDERRFVSLLKRCGGSGRMIRKAMLPEARGKRYMESHGWLLTIANDGKANLLHPFSRVHIKLPSFWYWSRKAVLSSSPSSCSSTKESSFVLMVIFVASGKPGFWRPGDKTWTTVDTQNWGWGVAYFHDITYYNGQFYGVDTKGRVFVFDYVGGPNPTTSSRLVGGIPHELIAAMRPYIVELAGELLVLVRDGCDHRFTANERPDETSEFRVFRVNVSNGSWEDMNSLGDNAVFLGHNASVSVEASKFPGIKANCIYYTDDCWIKGKEGKDMGIYNMADRSRTLLYDKGELLIVARDGCDHSIFTSEIFYPDNHPDKTSKFRVFQVDVSYGRWEGMKSLGGQCCTLGSQHFNLC